MSVDSVFVHKMWNDNELSKMVKGGVPFPMLSDGGGKVGTAYGVYDEDAGVENRGRFIIDPDGVILFTQRSKTNNQGILSIIYSTGVAPLPDGYYTLVVFAKNSEGFYSVDSVSIVRGTESNYGLKLLVQEDENSNGNARVQTRNNGAPTSLIATIVFPYQIGAENYGNETSIINNPGIYETFNLRMPTNGTSVVLLTGLSGVPGFSRRLFVYPSELSAKFSTIVGPQNLPENVELIKYEKLVVIRDCIFKAVLYVWSD